MDNISANNFSYSVGGVALGGTAVSLYRWGKRRLPGTRMKSLDSVVNETRNIYSKSDEEGLLPSDFKAQMGPKIAQLERSREELRERTYRAITLFDQIVASVQGLSTQIKQNTDNAKALRAQVVTQSEETRRRREARDAVPPSSDEVPSSTADAPFSTNDITGGTAGRTFLHSQSSSSETTLVPAIPQAATAQTCQSTTVDAIPICTPAVSKPPCSILLIGSHVWSGRTHLDVPPLDIESGGGFRYMGNSN